MAPFSKKNVSIYILALILFIILFFVPRIMQTGIPMTNSEVREAYSAYSIIKTFKDTNGKFLPILFQADGNYLSTLGVYFKIPGILLFGLNSFGVRSVGVVVGIGLLIAFYLFANEFTKSKTTSLLAVFVISLSPILLQSNVLNLGASLALLFSLFGLYFLIKKRIKLFWLFCIIATLSDFASLPFLLVFYISQQDRKKLKKSIFMVGLASLLIIGLLFKFDKSLFGYLKDRTVISSWLPQSYTFQIDKRISFEKIYGSVLLTQKINFNRIAFNKLYFGSEAIFRSFVTPFNFEKIFSPFQSQTVLTMDGSNLRFLPQLYFWELPIITAGIVISFKKNKKLLWLFVSAFESLLLFPGSLIFLLPAIVISEVYAITHLFAKLKLGKIIIAASALMLFWIMNYLIFADILLNNYSLWMPEQDVRQYQMWNFVDSTKQDWPAIYVTDRLGEPVFYYLYYLKIDPKYFIENKVNGPLLNNQTRRIDSVGTVFFGSFNYPKSYDYLTSLYMGLSGEFIGKNRDASTYSSVENGQILKRIDGVDTSEKKTLGGELWFVKNTLPVEVIK